MIFRRHIVENARRQESRIAFSVRPSWSSTHRLCANTEGHQHHHSMLYYRLPCTPRAYIHRPMMVSFCAECKTNGIDAAQEKREEHSYVANRVYACVCV